MSHLKYHRDLVVYMNKPSSGTPAQKGKVRQMSPLEVGVVKMTIQLDWLKPEHVSKIHAAAKASRTKIRGCGSRTYEVGEEINFIEVTKCVTHPGGNFYKMILTVHTALHGWIEPTPQNNRRGAVVRPSRQGLAQILDAAGILPAEEVIEEIPGFSR